MQSKPVLVATALEATWPTERPVIFLGEWCLRYSRREAWGELEYTVAPYHWSDRSRIPVDLEYINEVYERMLPELAASLNLIHGVDHSVRYWRIVAGWWLFYFAQIFFDRWQIVQGAAELFPNAELLRLPATEVPPASCDMTQFLLDMREDCWNERLSADIAALWTTLEVSEVEPAARPPAHGRVLSASRSSLLASTRSRILAAIRRPMNWAANQRLFFGSGVALHSDYLRLEEKLGLAFLLRSMPSVSIPVPLRVEAAREESRNWTLELGGKDDFIRALAASVPKYLPICYLEGYAGASSEAEKSWWRRSPRVIMTANAFSGDDRWAMWAAKQCEMGTKLVVAQHGGHYGMGKWSATQMHEIAISDRYLSWGWDDPTEPKVFAAPAVKLIGLPRARSQGRSTCLLVETGLPRQSDSLFSAPVGPGFSRYLDDQWAFVGALRNEVKDQLLVRQDVRDYGWDVAERWSDRHPSIATDPGATPLSRLQRRARLMVVSYNATTYLEAFTSGIPTVMFWDPTDWELSASAQPYFDLLRREGILHDDAVCCAHHVNAIWDDVSAWWTSTSVQAALDIFSGRYAYVGQRPLRELRAALTTW